jgi:hypothetical protein
MYGDFLLHDGERGLNLRVEDLKTAAAPVQRPFTRKIAIRIGSEYRSGGAQRSSRQNSQNPVARHPFAS